MSILNLRPALDAHIPRTPTYLTKPYYGSVFCIVQSVRPGLGLDDTKFKPSAQPLDWWW